MDDPPICPDYWPRSVWQLHFAPIPFKRHGPSPVNYPPVLDEIFALINAHTLTYLQADQKAAQIVRNATEKRIVELAPMMSGERR
jgi:hypothetical protein